jgi:hypothetical protein
MPQVARQLEQLQKCIRGSWKFSAKKEELLCSKPELSQSKQESPVRSDINIKIKAKGRSEMPINKTLILCEKTISARDFEEV